MVAKVKTALKYRNIIAVYFTFLNLIQNQPHDNIHMFSLHYLLVYMLTYDIFTNVKSIHDVEKTSNATLVKMMDEDSILILADKDGKNVKTPPKRR